MQLNVSLNTFNNFIFDYINTKVNYTSVVINI